MNFLTANLFDAHRLATRVLVALGAVGVATLSFGRANAGASAPVPPAPTRALARDLLEHLIAINSTHAHGSSAAAQYVADQLKAAGFRHRWMTVRSNGSRRTSRPTSCCGPRVSRR